MTICGAEKYDAVIFDFNGVLLWDNHLHEEAWRRYSARLRGYPMTDEEMALHVHGRVNRDIFDYILEKPLPDEEIRSLAQEKEVVYRELAIAAGDNYHLSPGAEALLDYLLAEEILIAIATSSPWDNVSFFTERLGLRRWFPPDRIIYDRGTYPGKPAPDIYLEAAERLGISPERCVVAEDSVAGIRAAHAAGAGGIVAVAAGENHAILGELPGVVAVIDNLNQFPRNLVRTDG